VHLYTLLPTVTSTTVSSNCVYRPLVSNLPLFHSASPMSAWMEALHLWKSSCCHGNCDAMKGEPICRLQDARGPLGTDCPAGYCILPSPHQAPKHAARSEKSLYYEGQKSKDLGWGCGSGAELLPSTHKEVQHKNSQHQHQDFRKNRTVLKFSFTFSVLGGTRALCILHKCSTTEPQPSPSFP
jgi:hypothetical protein